MNNAISAATSGKAEASALTEVENSLSAYAQTSAVTADISAATNDMATQTWVGQQGYLTEHQSLSAYSTTDEMNNAISAATSGKADSSDAAYSISSVVQNDGIHFSTYDKTGGQIWYSDLANISFANPLYTDYDDGKVKISGLVETSSITSSVTSASTDSEIPTAKAVYDAIPTGGSVTIDSSLDSGSTNAVANSAITAAINDKANKSAAFGSYSFGEASGAAFLKFKNVSNNDIGNELYYPKINNKEILTNNLNWAKINLNFSLVETSSITSSVTSASTDSEIPTAKAVFDAIPTGGSITIDSSLDSGSTNAVANSAITDAIESVSGSIPTTTSAVTSGSTAVIESGGVYEQLGGLKLVKMTTAQYEALSGNTDSNTLYILTDN